MSIHTYTRGLRGQEEDSFLHRVLKETDSCECCAVCPTFHGEEEVTTIQLLAVGGDGHYLDFIPNRFRQRAEQFYLETGINVTVVPQGDLDNLNKEILADADARVYDGYVFLPFLTGSLVEKGGLADLTEFVRTSTETNWTDVFRFNRDVQAVYDNTVRLLPCDGDVHSLYYRKDLFEKYNITVPRTWDEYDKVAQFFHGKEEVIPQTNGTNTTTLIGSCVGREPGCLDFQFFNLLVHSTTTQYEGTNTGFLFDTKTFDPLMGEAMAETLRHMENQIRYGAPDELTSNRCSGLNIDLLNSGQCAMTYHWGDVFARHLLEGSVLEGVLGIAPTPGVSRVYDRATKKLVECDEVLCPFGETFDDIGRVNRAPYAAAGGWSVGVSAGVSPARQQAMSEFFGLVCGTEESTKDVIPNAKGPLFTGTDPYRASHFVVDKWVAKGYPRDTTELYKKTIEEQLNSENTVLDVRFPEAFTILSAMNDRIFAHLNASKTKVMNQEDRLAVANDIDDAWRQIIRDYDSRDDTTSPLLTVYQKSLNVYNPESQTTKGLSAGAIAGIVIGCSAFAAIVAGILAYVLIRREREKTEQQWVIKPEDIRLSGEVIGEGSFGVITKAFMKGTPVAVKASAQSYSRLESEVSAKGDGSTHSGSANNRRGSATIGRYSSHMLKEDLAYLVKLRHPRLVQTIGAMIDKKKVYVVFEFMEKGSLARVLSEPGSIGGSAGKEVELQWALQIAEGLQFLHQRSPPVGPLLHQELKASNVLIDGSFNAKVSNFALEARVIGMNNSRGSLLWAAPEVLNGEKPSKESDVYSYGMTIYEILARARPFLVRRLSKSTLTEITDSNFSDSDDECVADPAEGERIDYYGIQNGEKSTVPQIVSLVSNLTIEPPVRPEVPEDAPLVLRDLCVECWHKNPKRRPTIEEIVERLTAAVSPSSLTQQLVSRSTVFDSILPHHVQQALAKGESVPPETYEDVTVIFSDIVGFTATSALLTAEEVGDLIARLFTKFDSLAAKYGVKKLDVIGDAFLGVAGIPSRMADHAPRAACFALSAVEAATNTPICMAKPQLGTVRVRFGLCSGPVVAAVIGSAQHPKYTLFGNTVNTASRMESSSEPNRVQCTEETAKLIQEQTPSIVVEYRDKMEVKGRGELDTYFLDPPKDGSLPEFLSSAAKTTRRLSTGDLSDSASFRDKRAILSTKKTSTLTATSSEKGETVEEAVPAAGDEEGGDS